MKNKFKSKKTRILIFISIIVFLLCVSVFSIINKIDKRPSDQVTQELQGLIKNNKYQVFVFDTPLNYPLDFARHPWFVINEKGKISRWEVHWTKDKKTKNHLQINSLPTFEAFHVSFFGFKKYFWKPELLGFLEGDESSTAKQAIYFIEKSGETYPYQFRYSLVGPNSNTYAELILDKFPEFNIKLSWRYIGKDFKVENSK